MLQMLRIQPKRQVLFANELAMSQNEIGNNIRAARADEDSAAGEAAAGAAAATPAALSVAEAIKSKNISALIQMLERTLTSNSVDIALARA